MHEYSIAANIINIVIEKAEQENTKKILNIKVKIGKMSGVIPECLKSAFEIAATSTICENTKLNITECPVKAKCRSCSAEFEVKDYKFICPECSNAGVDIISGKEMFIESIEVD